MINVAAAALMLLSAGHDPASSTTTVNSSAAVQQSVRVDTSASQRVCVRTQDATGTILMRSVCRTRAEWDRAGGVPTEARR